MSGRTSGRYSLAPAVVSRYESRLGVGVVFDPAAGKARRIDELLHSVLRILADEGRSVEALAELTGIPREKLARMCRSLCKEGFLINEG